jgi:hypothetical protein
LELITQIVRIAPKFTKRLSKTYLNYTVLKVTKKQQQEEFYKFLDAIIENAPADLSANEIWMPDNLFKLLKTKSYKGFKMFTSMFLTNNEVILGRYNGTAQIN